MEIRISLDRVTTRNSLAVVAAGMAAGLVVWAVVRLLGVDLTVESGSGTTQVGVVDVLLTTLVAGLVAWGVFALLLRRRRARWWPFVGSTALAISMAGPSYLADGIAAVSLICMHVVVGVVLITGFMRAVPNPYRIADTAAGRPWYRG
jgi:FtsH-binding integral membrane protein